MNRIQHKCSLPVNVIIMAGGKGTRLQSLTAHTHKSLLEVAGKPVILHLVEHLVSFEFYTIYISVGHFSEQIIDFLGDGSKWGASIKYIQETKPMGSIGALSLKNDWEYENFLVINGDIFTNFNLYEFVSDFFSKEADMTVLTYESQIEIPWGVLMINHDGEITDLVEKPRYLIQTNAGIYLFNQSVIKLLPSKVPTEGWELIQLALKMKYKIISGPLNEGYWVDIGTKETLLKAQKLSTHTLQAKTYSDKYTLSDSPLSK
ncbi:sugar phosphate nucleotidyltransferase [Spirosoma panaciterrae]|uniref:sugar phosphate nucleotidyltransferase n=1 Tax=Spirosoma panaciterrae TaxID=496058 RepID=UPI000374153D|nr:sugar phosphate nucleotidyltransferase [Spirosoma panaciterrae]